MVKAIWTGEYPTLCAGEWVLEIDGVDMSEKIPEDDRHSGMFTFGMYRDGHCNMDASTAYEAGYKCDQWIDYNKTWLDTITTDYKTQVEIFEAISKEDFRGCCGGCQ
jgi:hypothetical protein